MYIILNHMCFFLLQQCIFQEFTAELHIWYMQNHHYLTLKTAWGYFFFCNSATYGSRLEIKLILSFALFRIINWMNTNLTYYQLHRQWIYFFVLSRSLRGKLIHNSLMGVPPDNNTMHITLSGPFILKHFGAHTHTQIC